MLLSGYPQARRRARPSMASRPTGLSLIIRPRPTTPSSLDVGLTAVADRQLSRNSPPATGIDTGPDRVIEGQLMYDLSKAPSPRLCRSPGRLRRVGDPHIRRWRLAATESVGTRPANGSLAAERMPVAGQLGRQATRISRMRMLPDYMEPPPTRWRGHLRLVRAINNGRSDWMFNNTHGDGRGRSTRDELASSPTTSATVLGNPGNVQTNAADLGGSGACSPNPCAATQIRKVNAAIDGRALQEPGCSGSTRFFEQHARNRRSACAAWRSSIRLVTHHVEAAVITYERMTH